MSDGTTGTRDTAARPPGPRASTSRASTSRSSVPHPFVPGTAAPGAGAAGPPAPGTPEPGPATGSQSSLHRANLDRVLHAVRVSGALTQAEIARGTGLSAATVSTIVRELQAAGRVEVTPTSSGGRRARHVSLSRAAGIVIGIDFGHRHLRVAVGDFAHRVLAEERVPIDVDSSADEGFGQAARLLEALLERAGVGRHEITGVGVGVPGPIDIETGALGSTTILPGWAGSSPRAQLEDLLGLPVLVDNDANLGALGELVWGAGAGCTEMAYLKVSGGVGAGLVVGGRLYRGPGGTAGEIGHLTLDESGPVCRCGNRGCLETFTKASHLLGLLRDSHGPDLTLPRMIELAAAGDAGCRRVVTDAGRHLGVGVASLTNLLNPQRVVLGGDLARAGELLIAPITESVGRYAIPSASRRLTVVTGALGERAEVLGAMAMVMGETAPFAPAGAGGGVPFPAMGR